MAPKRRPIPLFSPGKAPTQSPAQLAATKSHFAAQAKKLGHHGPPPPGSPAALGKAFDITTAPRKAINVPSKKIAAFVSRRR